mmetsp:Transcript_76498/g.151372  ORF Transcript_76498/g.151372 Transcript_76498/m.151372 type:complete len:85 (+) Transcript_76498:1308-1562(+)
MTSCAAFVKSVGGAPGGPGAPVVLRCGLFDLRSWWGNGTIVKERAREVGARTTEERKPQYRQKGSTAAEAPSVLCFDLLKCPLR